MNSPRISFGIIVLNGEPFTRFCLEALYPHAHEIIVAEGAAESAREFATPDGHSTDGTLEVLRDFQAHHDPEGKVIVVTCPEGQTHWKGREEQSQAYARRATGDYLWQVDIDEFYLPGDIEAVRGLLAADPTIDGASFRWVNFWGGPDTICDGWYLQRGGGDVCRLFRWGPGFRYEGHWTGPTSVTPDGRRARDGHWLRASELAADHGIRCYHYSYVFRSQVFKKMKIYTGGTDPVFEHRDSDKWAQEVWLELRDPFHAHSKHDEPGWLERYRGPHPEAARRMFAAVEADPVLRAELRPSDDVDRLLASPGYRIKRAIVGRLGRLARRLGGHRGYWVARATELWLEIGVTRTLGRVLRSGARRLLRGRPRPEPC